MPRNDDRRVDSSSRVPLDKGGYRIVDMESLRRCILLAPLVTAVGIRKRFVLV